VLSASSCVKACFPFDWVVPAARASGVRSLGFIGLLGSAFRSRIELFFWPTSCGPPTYTQKEREREREKRGRESERRKEEEEKEAKKATLHGNKGGGETERGGEQEKEAMMVTLHGDRG
jgi:hypothetical protein